MSNPGVISLAKDTIDGKRFAIEDNIGEAVHLHYGSLRLDMTIKDLFALGDKMEYSLEELLPGVDVRNIDPEFLPFFAKCSRDLKHVEHTFADATELYSVISRCYTPRNLREIAGDVRTISDTAEPHPYEVILFYDGDYIMSGLKQAVWLYRQHPEAKIPITRYHFADHRHTYRVADIQQQLRRYEDCQRIIRQRLGQIPAGSRVAFRGGGVHADRFMSLMPPDREIVCVFERSPVVSYDLRQRKVLPAEQIPNIQVDVMIICSFQYRCEMREELNGIYQGEVIDFYEEFLRHDYQFSKPYYMMKVIDQWLVMD